MWYRYSAANHRWFFDRDGPGVVLLVHRILGDLLAELRARANAAEEEATEADPVASAGPGAQRNGGPAPGTAPAHHERAPAPRPPPLTFMVNFPATLRNDVSFIRAVVVHLDAAIGTGARLRTASWRRDMRHVQSILRALALFVHRDDFASRLDVENEFLIPLANGVLDMEHGVLRPGRPEDLVMRGPDYAWRDYASSDADVLDTNSSCRKVIHGL